MTPESAENPAAASSVTTRKDQIQFITANTTAQIGNSLRTRVAYNNSWEKRKGLLANPNGLDPDGTNYSKTSEFPNWTLSGNADWVPSQKFVVGMRGGYFKTDWHDTNVTNEPRYHLDHHEQHRVPGRSRVVAARHRLHQHPDEHWVPTRISSPARSSTSTGPCTRAQAASTR